MEADLEAKLVKGKSGWYKRPLDLLVLLFAHILLFPLWIFLWTVIPIAILVDSGRPVFYKQRRMGQKGRIFHALKFRTMVKNADKIGPAWTVSDDPRLTRVGSILRGTALDELPQVINILKGDMSFVGPRALAEEEYRQLIREIPGFAVRAAVRPGLTGLAQVYGNREDSRQKIDYDLQYIQSQSPWRDIKLLFLSVWITLRSKWETRGPKL